MWKGGFRHPLARNRSTRLPTRLKNLNKPFISQDTMKAFRDIATVRSFLPGHNDEVFAVNQNAEFVFRDQLPGRNSDVQPILRLPVRIPIRPDNKLSQSVDKPIVAFVPMPHLNAVRNAYP